MQPPFKKRFTLEGAVLRLQIELDLFCKTLLISEEEWKKLSFERGHRCVYNLCDVKRQDVVVDRLRFLFMHASLFMTRQRYERLTNTVRDVCLYYEWTRTPWFAAVCDISYNEYNRPIIKWMRSLIFLNSKRKWTVAFNEVTYLPGGAKMKECETNFIKLQL